MSKSKWISRLAAASLVSVTLLGVALAAGNQGSQADPLVTLSYLTNQATPEIMAQVDAKTAAREKELLERLDSAVNAYTKEVEDKLKSAGGGGAAVAFTLVDLAAGQRLNPGVGCELMLRVGSATVTADSAPALIDMTDGAGNWGGSALVQNHLYMATIEGRSVVAQNAVKLLVRGSYTVG